MYTPVNPIHMEVGRKGVYITRACYMMILHRHGNIIAIPGSQFTAADLVKGIQVDPVVSIRSLLPMAILKQLSLKMKQCICINSVCYMAH